MNDAFLLAGLGNPGPIYANNRHNVGFKVIEAVVDANISVEFKKMASIAQAAFFDLDKIRIIAAKPLVFMNLSGQAVRFLADFYKIPPEKIFVFHDDIDLKFGKIKIKKGGGNGGHNGLKSIDSLLGNDYWRVRIGVGRPKEKSMVASYVLENFSDEEQLWLQNIFREISRNIPLLLENYKQLEAKLNAVAQT
ncbi:MAG: aminoacyl-tRNA hydrolase [Holosporaceae bacterium]|jgi:PTH1 family peptidyl-tRNA hydrolase|nr:aminoacyl-tRNA hydrolase [Holosporaceae bacterium]